MSSILPPAMSHGPRHIKTYLNWIKDKRFLAPNLKELHLWKFASQRGNGHSSNKVAFELVKYHLLAFRWMNPNALVYLHEARVDTPQQSYVEFELWDGRKRKFMLQSKYSPELVLAKVMFAARDPAFDPQEFKEQMASKYEEERQQVLDEKQQQKLETIELYKHTENALLTSEESLEVDKYGERLDVQPPIGKNVFQYEPEIIQPYEGPKKYIDYPNGVEDLSENKNVWDTRPESVKKAQASVELEQLVEKHIAKNRQQTHEGPESR